MTRDSRTRWFRLVRQWLIRRTGGQPDAGRVTAFTTLFCTALLAVAGLVLDGGLAVSAKVQALDVAQAAARAGAQQLDLDLYRTTGVAQLDPTRAAQAARNWLTAAGADGEVTEATTEHVTITVRRTRTTQLLHLVGVGELHISATATATAIQGVTGEDT